MTEEKDEQKYKKKLRTGDPVDLGACAVYLMIMHDVMTKKKGEHCLPPCHALTVVG